MTNSTTSDFRINNFDLLRIFAATQVLLLHSYLYLNIDKPKWLNFLELFPGVPMFFIMSGYLISASLERNPKLSIYFKNRALRIYPGLCFCIILSVITISLVGNINFFSIKSLIWFLCQCLGLIYSPSFIAGYGIGSYHVSLWTIPVEMQFYVVLPIVYLFVDNITTKEKVKTWFLVAVFIAFCFCAYFINENYTASSPSTENLIQKLLRYSFLPHIYMFLFGVILQRIRLYRSKFIFGKGLLWTVIYLLFNFILPGEGVFLFTILRYLLLGITSISLAYSFPTLSEKILRGNDVSYGVYIYHGLAIGVLVELGYIKDDIFVLVVFIVTYLIAIFSWKLIEKPFLKKKKKSLKPVETLNPSLG